MGLSFAADWLTLREPFDHAARPTAVTAAARRHLEGIERPLVVDLGCGRGSNVRFLESRLPAHTRWRLIDRDTDLLAAARTALPSTAVETVPLDLRDPALASAIEGADLVTAAALIDLVGGAWLERLVDLSGAMGAALLVTGSVDGSVLWEPALAGDAAMARAHAHHQGADKGFGPALGGAAPGALDRLSRARGWRVVTGRADWSRVANAAMQRAYLSGVVEALAGGAVDAAVLRRWSEARRGAIDDGTSRLTVGHIDLFAAPPT